VPPWHGQQPDLERGAGDWCAAVFNLARLLEVQPADAELRQRRAQVVVAAVAKDPKDWLALAAHARLCLAAGDRAGYRKACATLAQASAAQDGPHPADAARLCTLA